ncbi:putative glycerophosphodiester phosphodiesterase, protein kinase RLK-Pelle-LRK10L-2 family [Medicago truncatula]|uniref:Putative glycerophosphodiester phosphodiesterase, protein kinase RLK-Pelle-LRK10L-2 family n=1 Tax=Medicago truncatula TaxID=3880 RepID=A0A396JKR8_MEDTR|nr:rust resistance kinase Lr10 [Medicago truncatula]RHN77784.1 putative glycerophosphodiester phosphodiesterase, protein kinase RLK-Pelle-LRK10L-2 family [Medicago truncatula]
MICSHITFSLMIMITITLVLIPLLGNAQKIPTIRCPFNLSCNHHNKKILEIPSYPVPIKLLINYINYTSQVLEASDPENCLPRLLLLQSNFTSSIFPFRIIDGSELPPLYNEFTNISFFDCSSLGQRYLKNDGSMDRDEQQDLISCPIYMAASEDDMVDLNLVFCTKLSQRVSPLILPAEYSNGYTIQQTSISLSWSETNLDNGCFKCKNKSKKIILSSAGAMIGSTVLVLVFGFIFQIYRYFKMKSEDHTRIENFLKDYSALKPTRFSYADLKRITNKFKDKIGEGAHGAVYKGKLSNQILVAVKILNNTEEDGKEFINEVGTMGKIHHLNVVRLLGFCADGFRRALVYDFFSNGSLQKFISPANSKDDFLGWDKLQKIALGIANGIEYLHQGCDQRILHFDINPHNVLLDDNFTPKITDFGLAKICSKNQSVVSMTAAKGTLGYMAPEVFSRNFGNVSYKSDIYSYGMLLLEMVGGRKNTKTISGEENIQVEYPDWIHNLLEGEIQIPIDEDGDFRIPKKLATVGLWCIQWHPLHRPTMKSVMQMLQGEGDKLKVPTNPFGPTTTTNKNVNIVAERMNLELEVIEELE